VLVRPRIRGYGALVEAWSRWRGGVDNDRRWMFWAVLSVLLHVPFTPLVGVLGLVGWFLSTDQDIPEAPPITTIPIELFEEEAAAPEPPAPPAPVDPAAVPTPAPEPGPKPAPKAPPEKPPTPDAGAPDAGPPPKPSTEAPDGSAPIADPVALSGGVRRVVDPNANVRLIIDTEKLRSHPLGPRVGLLLARVHQWRDFMGPTGVDPVRDIDRVLIVGPQLRRTGDVVAVIQHGLGRDAMRGAIDALVRRDPNGAWLDEPVPVARASADRAERYFVLPSERIVVVTPKSALDAAKGMTRALKIPALAGSQVATAYVATPHRAFRGMPLRVPESIKWARARVTPLEGGGARIDIEAEDASAEQAAANARELEGDIVAATQINLGFLGVQRFVQKVALHAEGKRILGEILLSQKQLISIFEMAQALFVPPSRPTTPSAPGTVGPNPDQPSERPSPGPASRESGSPSPP
jgi:hypothetical protein